MVNKEWYKTLLQHAQRTRPETKITDLIKNYRNETGLSLTKLGLHVICSMDIEREEFKRHAESMEKHAKQIYAEFERAAKQEEQREKNSKSARIARKLEQMKLTNDLVEKIKLRQQLKK